MKETQGHMKEMQGHMTETQGHKKGMRRLFHGLDSARLRWRMAWGGYYKFFAGCRGVEFLGGCRFMGRPKFKLYPGTRVIVGNGCTFLSGHTDNLIGINRPCIVSVYNPGTVVTIG